MMIWANIHSVCPELSDSERCKASGYWIMIFTDSDNAKNPISSLQNAREHAIFDLKTTHLGVLRKGANRVHSFAPQTG